MATIAAQIADRLESAKDYAVRRRQVVGRVEADYTVNYDTIQSMINADASYGVWATVDRIFTNVIERGNDEQTALGNVRVYLKDYLLDFRIPSSTSQMSNLVEFAKHHVTQLILEDLKRMR